MKKILLITLVVLLLLSTLGCNNNSVNTVIEEPLNLNVATLKGPTGIGMIQLIDSYTNPTDNLHFNYIIESSPDSLVAKLIKGELDIAAVPTNLASIIYNKTEGNYKLANINTLNVMYIVSKGAKIDSIKDLKGKTLYISGQGATPDYVTRYLLKENNLEIGKDIEVNYTLDHASLSQAILSGDVEIGVLPEPFVTTTMMKDPEVTISVDLLEEWEKIADDTLLALGGIIIKTELIENHPEIVTNFLNEYKSSVNYVNNNIVESSKLVEKHKILPSAKLAELAIPKCNIVYMDASENKENLDKYYKILFDFNPKSIGGKLPDSNFYYQK